jgi:hypothetical protein
VPWALVTRHVEGVTALTGCPRGWVPQLLAEGRASDAYTAAGELRDVFGEHLAVECWDHRLPEERALVQQLVEQIFQFYLNNPVHFYMFHLMLLHFQLWLLVEHPTYFLLCNPRQPTLAYWHSFLQIVQWVVPLCQHL